MNPETDKLLLLKAEVIQAIGHPIRLAIVSLLGGGELCVCDIAVKVHAERSNVSRHLSVMQKAGVLSVRKDGLRMMYSLKTPCVLKLLACIDDVIRKKLQDDSRLLKQLKR